MDFKLKDQVVVRRPVTPWSRTNEVRVGQITAFADEKTATVTFALFGGRVERKEVPLAELSPVSKVYGRAGVNVNPVHRQIGWVER